MNVDVVIEKRFYADPSGAVWTDNAFPLAFWSRYKTVFDTVTIVARVHDVDQPEPGWKQVNGPGVHVYGLPAYVGLNAFVKSLPATIAKLKQRKGQAERAIYRVPGVLSWLYHHFAAQPKQPYGAEVVGDPADTFAASASEGVLRPLIRRGFMAMLKRQCRQASSIAYVTQHALQRRYPPAANAFNTHYSSIKLDNNDYQTRSHYALSKQVKLLCIGNLSQPYKGCDTMLQTLHLLNASEASCHLTWVGGGELLGEMKALANTLGVADAVTFTGNVADRDQIRQLLDGTDLFILPSRQEGLPRVLIEAMARSCLCVATRVGGVPELIDNTFIVPRDNAQALYDGITMCMSLPEAQKLAVASSNYIRSQDYHNNTLARRREAMYRHLREAV